MSVCPCCTNQLLRHIRGGQIHWFCRYCWLDMPNLTIGKRKTGHHNFQINYSTHSLLVTEGNKNQLVS